MARWAWDPFHELESMRRDLNRVLGEVAGGNGRGSRAAFLPGRAARAYPLVNVSEDRDNVYVEALAPGVNPESLDVCVVRNQLQISGEKQAANGNAKPEAFHRSERASGRFVRSVDLPAEVDADKVRAEYKNGILRVTLPKAEAHKPKQIQVKVA